MHICADIASVHISCPFVHMKNAKLEIQPIFLIVITYVWRIFGVFCIFFGL